MARIKSLTIGKISEDGLNDVQVLTNDNDVVQHIIVDCGIMICKGANNEIIRTITLANVATVKVNRE